MLRKLDPLGRRAVAVTGQLIRKRRLSRAEAQKTGLILSTSSGPLSTVEAFQRGLISDGAGNSRLFPNTVMNAAAGHVAVQFGLHGPTATICSGSTGTVGALHFASQLLRTGAADRIVILAVDEASDALIAGYARMPGFLARDDASPFADSGLVFSGGAVALMVELEPTDPDQGFIASIDGFGFAGDGSKNGRVSSDGVAWAASLTAAATAAGSRVRDADLVVCSAGGRGPMDESERRALEIAGASDSALSVPKRFLGESQSAAPLLGVLAGVWAKRRGEFPAPVVPQTHADVSRVLVSAADPGGNYQAVMFGV
jgi:3-oxoacyl-[acyl-carrier-protein] synthase II